MSLSTISQLEKSLKNLIRKGYNLATIVDSFSLGQVTFAKNIDNLPSTTTSN